MLHEMQHKDKYPYTLSIMGFFLMEILQMSFGSVNMQR
jgi:hypothetical protein